MTNKTKSEQLDFKINQLKELETKFNELAFQCKNLLINVEEKEKNIETNELRFQNAIEKKLSDIKNLEDEFLSRVLKANISLEEKDIYLNKVNERKTQELIYIENALKKMYEEKSKGIPWLSGAIAEFYYYKDVEIAKYLENKSHPAPKKAEEVLKISEKSRILRKQKRIAENYVNYYETLFPWLSDYRDESLSDLLDEIENEKKEVSQDQDPVLRFVPKGEYKRLSEEERNQKALDRYIGFGKKSFWRLGRDYERYIGYLYEKRGYKVSYEGIIKGFEDLGRDLICVKDNEIEIVQCKYWAQYKQIHEKHINQLYGTVVQFFIEHREIVNPKGKLRLFSELIKSGEIKATFVTSTKLSETAIKFAEALGIKVEQEKPLEKYPVIKCNIAVDGSKIYHLPFDQQYDTTLINKPDEFYAATVKEAMEKGFRRAYRWSGAK